MRVLVSGASGKTGRHVIAALAAHRQAPALRGFSRSGSQPEGVEVVHGDLESPADRARAVVGMDVVVHYGPPFHPRETAMGTGMIDAAVQAGVGHFVFISVIHPQIGDLLNHRSKLEVEEYLIRAGIPWTILRPQHYMQNIDVAEAIATGELVAPYPATTRLGHVDMADLADAVCTVIVEPGHFSASYDISSDAHLSPEDICDRIATLAGRPVTPREIAPDDLIAMISQHHPLPAYSIEAMQRLFGYYRRTGLSGNANILRWLLGREPTGFDDYVRRGLRA